MAHETSLRLSEGGVSNEFLKGSPAMPSEERSPVTAQAVCDPPILPSVMLTFQSQAAPRTPTLWRVQAEGGWCQCETTAPGL